MLLAQRVFKRVPSLARSVGVAMIAAALIAFALRPDTFTYKGAIMLISTGLVFWVIGAAFETAETEVSP